MRLPNHKDLENLKHPDFVFLVMATIFLITPGILVTFYFFRDIFNAIDTVKLIFLSIALVSPFVTINTFLLLYANTDDKSPEKDREQFYPSFLGSVFLSGLLLYIAVFIGYNANLEFHKVLNSVLGLEFLFFVWQMTAGIRKRERLKNKSK